MRWEATRIFNPRHRPPGCRPAYSHGPSGHYRVTIVTVWLLLPSSNTWDCQHRHNTRASGLYDMTQDSKWPVPMVSKSESGITSWHHDHRLDDGHGMPLAEGGTGCTGITVEPRH